MHTLRPTEDHWSGRSHRSHSQTAAPSPQRQLERWIEGLGKTLIMMIKGAKTTRLLQVPARIQTAFGYETDIVWIVCETRTVHLGTPNGKIIGTIPAPQTKP